MADRAKHNGDIFSKDIEGGIVTLMTTCQNGGSFPSRGAIQMVDLRVTDKMTDFRVKKLLKIADFRNRNSGWRAPRQWVIKMADLLPGIWSKEGEGGAIIVSRKIPRRESGDWWRWNTPPPGVLKILHYENLFQERKKKIQRNMFLKICRH